MNRITFAALGVSLVVAAACSSGSDEHAPPPVSDGGASTAGAGGAHQSTAGNAGTSGRPAGGKSSVSDDAGQGGTTSEGGAIGQGGEAGLEPGMVVVVPPSACSETAKWKSPGPLTGISGAGVERLLSITADELDVLFVRDGSVLLAHRNKANADFGTATAVMIPPDYDTTAGAALSADGKTLLLVAKSGQAFASLTRASRTAAFSATADDSAFYGLNQRAIQTMEHYAAPVLSPDGKSLVYTGFTPEPEQGFPAGVEGVARVYESLWANKAWQMPESISDGFFNGTTAGRPLPSGLSSDSRTLFYFDEKTMTQAARFRDRPDAPLNLEVDLGGREGAMPNAGCDVLYYTSDGDVISETH
jgi:WD40-like Beta Propeller Repeat